MRLVGRLDELARLEAALPRTGNGTGGLTLVSGDAGIGKTRLVEELANRATQRGLAVLWGRCFEGASAFAPFVDAISGYLAGSNTAHHTEEEPPAALAKIVPGLPAEDRAAAALEPRAPED